MKKNNGFTLIEILVVMGIIAVLAAIVLIAINPARQFAQARNTQRNSNVNAILNAIGQYVADNGGNLPDDLEDLADNTPTEIGDDELDICDDLVSEYLPALPVDPNPDTTEDSDEPIEESDCDGTEEYDTEYWVEKDSENRITVCSEESDEEDALPLVTEEICVTR
jgi:prepilin-type N-terminal cleavage/methylation domain-containing protein